MRVYGADGADGAVHHPHRKHYLRSGSQDHHPVHGTIRTVNTTYAAALKSTTHPKTRFRKPYAATQHLMLLMMGVCTRKHVELRIHQ